MYLGVLPVPGVGHGVRRRQRLVRPHRVCGTHRPRLQHDPRGPSHWYLPPSPTTALHRTAPLHKIHHQTAKTHNHLLFAIRRAKLRSRAISRSKGTLRLHRSLFSKNILFIKILNNNVSFILYPLPSI